MPWVRLGAMGEVEEMIIQPFHKIPIALLWKHQVVFDNNYVYLYGIDILSIFIGLMHDPRLYRIKR